MYGTKSLPLVDPVFQVAHSCTFCMLEMYFLEKTSFHWEKKKKKKKKKEYNDIVKIKPTKVTRWKKRVPIQ